MTLNIWRITDGKSGHDSQSTGLCQAIKNLSQCKQYDLEAVSFIESIKSYVSKKFPYGEHLPDPDLIIGAGHKTHLTMLSAKQARKGKIIVLMKPSLPLSCFDLCIIPKHDAPKKKENVITSNGALNALKFNKSKQKKLGVILIGGPSKHYRWDTNSIVKQVNMVVTVCNEIRWTISNSPRTPKNIISKISKLNHKNVDISYFEKGNSKKIKDLIFLADNIWVSPDSISMIYESLTSGAKVGLFDLSKEHANRINDSIDCLITEKSVMSFRSWKKGNKLTANNLILSEAQRCASIILNKMV